MRSQAKMLTWSCCALSRRRYTYTLDPENVLAVVNALSRPNLQHDNYSPDAVDWPTKKGERECDCNREATDL